MCVQVSRVSTGLSLYTPYFQSFKWIAKWTKYIAQCYC